MPLMREWTEIHVEEGLLVDVVKELLALAEDPNHVEVVYGVTGRVILAHPKLAEEWFQSVNKEPAAQPAADPAATLQAEVEADPRLAPEVLIENRTSLNPGAPSDAPREVQGFGFAVISGLADSGATGTGNVEPATNVTPPSSEPPAPVKRGPGRPRKNPVPPPPPLNDGEESS